MQLNLIKMIQSILEKNSWAIYYKGEPLKKLPAQNGDFYQINEVSASELIKKLEETIQESIASKNKET